MNCGIGGDTGTSAVADIAAGSVVTFKWEYVRTMASIRVTYRLRVHSGPRVSLLVVIRSYM